MTMSPLEYLSQLVSGEIPKSPIGELMNIWGVEIEAGRAVFAAEPGEEHYNPVGVVHGGFLATLLDSAMACAVHSMLPRGGHFSTLEINVNYLRPLHSKSGPVTCVGTAVHIGTTIGTAEGRVTTEAGKLVATGTTTCMLFQLPAPDGTDR
jgi:uncharacterized protein (TIGR00369 family)